MKKQRTKSAARKADLDDPWIILFQAEKVVPKAGAVELHLFGSDTPGTLFGRSANDVKKDFEKSGPGEANPRECLRQSSRRTALRKRRDLSWA